MSEPGRRGQRRRTGWGVGVILAIILVAYVVSAVLYLQDLDQQYEPPPASADGLVVSLIPFQIDTRAQVVSTEMLIYPGDDLLTADKRLVDDITVDVFAAESQTLTFDQGTVPSPVKVNIPALGVVQRYPFDTYQYAAGVRAMSGGPGGAESVDIPTEVSVYFAVPGWDYQPQISESDFAVGERAVIGQISRDGSTRTIAVTFILLIMMFGVLAIVTIVSGRRDRVPFTIGTAAWLTGALFALVSLRNSLPGDPPLGSVMDVLVYFWVIAAIMVAIGISVLTLVARSSPATTTSAAGLDSPAPDGDDGT